MYLVFFGSDRLAVRDEVTKYLDEHMSKEASLLTIDQDNYEPGRVSDALGATSLFGGEEWFVLDTPSDSDEFLEEVKDNLSEMAESPNTFLIIENTLLAPQKKSYQKYAAEMVERKGETAQKFNAFTLTEALSQKDKKKLWVLLQEAKMSGLHNEEIVGVLWWQLKTLRLATLTKTASEAGMKDFPYNKAKRSISNFQTGEIEELSQKLLSLYHDDHAGVRSMDTALEEWVLTI